MRFRYPHSQSIKVYLNVRVRVGRTSRPKQLHLGYIGINDKLEDVKDDLLRALIERWPRTPKPNAIDLEDAKAKLDRLRSSSGGSSSGGSSSGGSGVDELGVLNRALESSISGVSYAQPEVSPSPSSDSAAEATQSEATQPEVLRPPSAEAMEVHPDSNTTEAYLRSQLQTAIPYLSKDTVNGPVYLAMRRAVDTAPAHFSFHDEALPLLTSATVVGARQDALLIVLQRERLAAEQRAVRQGLPSELVGWVGMNRRRTGTETRTFETDVIEDYLPRFLENVSREESHARNFPPFALHALDKYRNRLNQITRRERHRSQILWQFRGDDRAKVEYASGPDEGEITTVVASATMSAWVPSQEERLQADILLEELRNALDPLEFQVAELFMAGMIQQGDKGQIAKALGVSSSRISQASARIRQVLQRLGYS